MSSGGKHGLLKLIINNLFRNTGLISPLPFAAIFACFGVRGLEDFEGLYTDDIRSACREPESIFIHVERMPMPERDRWWSVWWSQQSLGSVGMKEKVSSPFEKKSCADDSRAKQVEFEFIFLRETIVQTFHSWSQIRSGADMTCKLPGDYRVMPCNHPRDPFGILPDEDLGSRANLLYRTPPWDKNTNTHCSSPRRQGQNCTITWDSHTQSKQFGLNKSGPLQANVGK